MKYPELFQKWRNHDLGYDYDRQRKIFLWENLRAEDEECVWLFIEEFYLDKYSYLIQVFPEYDSSGLWKISFPGSESLDGMISCGYLNLPQDVCRKLPDWQDYFDNYSLPWTKNDPCDYEKLNEWGLSVAKEVKRFLAPDFYVEYHLFRELIVIDNEVIELDVPEFIRNLSEIK